MRWIYSCTLLLSGELHCTDNTTPDFWIKVKTSAAIYITSALHTTTYTSVLLTKQAAKFAATRLHALSRWQAVPSGHFTTVEVDLVTPLNIDYVPVRKEFPLSDSE